MHVVCKWLVRTWTWICVLGLLGAAVLLPLNNVPLPAGRRAAPTTAIIKVSELDQFKGTVEDILELTPLPGMAKGVSLLIRDEGKEVVKVHLGPKDFVDLRTIALKKGDKVKVKGVWAEIDGQDVVMAAKIKKGETIELKLRLTKDGTPFWTMTPEEMARHQEQE